MPCSLCRVLELDRVGEKEREVGDKRPSEIVVLNALLTACTYIIGSNFL